MDISNWKSYRNGAFSKKGTSQVYQLETTLLPKMRKSERGQYIAQECVSDYINSRNIDFFVQNLFRRWICRKIFANFTFLTEKETILSFYERFYIVLQTSGKCPELNLVYLYFFFRFTYEKRNAEVKHFPDLCKTM